MAKAKPSLLIVDDERNTRDGLERLLKRHYDVHTAESGPQALELLEKQHVDVMLADIRMPTGPSTWRWRP